MSESTRPRKIAFTSFDPLVDTLPEYILTAHRPPQASTTDSAIGQIVQNSQYNLVLRQMMIRTLDPSKVKTVNIKLDRGAALQLRDHLTKVLAWWAEDDVHDIVEDDADLDALKIPEEDEDEPEFEPIFTEKEIVEKISNILRGMRVTFHSRQAQEIFHELRLMDALRLVKS